MARPYWSGNVQISLVAFGVSLYVATESKGQISFHQISRRTGERIRHQKVLESAAESREATTAVENDEIVKGYEYSKGKYVIIEPSELENLRIPSKHTIAVSQFVEVADLNPEYVEKPYFVTPENDMSAEAFNVVRQALVKTGKAAIGKVSFSGRENIIALVPAGADSPGMMAYTLRYQNELRNRADYFRDIKQPAIDADSLQLAETLISKMSGKLDINKFEDGYETAVKALVESKVNNLPIPIDQAPQQRPSNVVNLMDALRKSLGSETTSTKPGSPATGPSRWGGKKPPKSVKEAPAKGIDIVKSPAKSAKRKSA
jgi:DNA end-binding protein Ku